MAEQCQLVTLTGRLQLPKQTTWQVVVQSSTTFGTTFASETMPVTPERSQHFCSTASLNQNSPCLQPMALDPTDAGQPSSHSGQKKVVSSHGDARQQGPIRQISEVKMEQLPPVTRKAYGSGKPYAPDGWSWRIQTDASTKKGWWSDVVYTEDGTSVSFRRRARLADYFCQRHALTEEQAVQHVDAEFPKIRCKRRASDPPYTKMKRLKKEAEAMASEIRKVVKAEMFAEMETREERDNVEDGDDVESEASLGEDDLEEIVPSAEGQGEMAADQSEWSSRRERQVNENGRGGSQPHGNNSRNVVVNDEMAQHGRCSPRDATPAQEKERRNGSAPEAEKRSGDRDGEAGEKGDIGWRAESRRSAGEHGGVGDSGGGSAPSALMSKVVRAEGEAAGSCFIVCSSARSREGDSTHAVCAELSDPNGHAAERGHDQSGGEDDGEGRRDRESCRDKNVDVDKGSKEDVIGGVDEIGHGRTEMDDVNGGTGKGHNVGDGDDELHKIPCRTSSRLRRASKRRCKSSCCTQTKGHCLDESPEAEEAQSWEVEEELVGVGKRFEHFLRNYKEWGDVLLLDEGSQRSFRKYAAVLSTRDEAKWKMFQQMLLDHDLYKEDLEEQRVYVLKILAALLNPGCVLRVSTKACLIGAIQDSEPWQRFGEQREQQNQKDLDIVCVGVLDGVPTSEEQTPGSRREHCADVQHQATGDSAAVAGTRNDVERGGVNDVAAEGDAARRGSPASPNSYDPQRVLASPQGQSQSHGSGSGGDNDIRWKVGGKPGSGVARPGLASGVSDDGQRSWTPEEVQGMHRIMRQRNLGAQGAAGKEPELSEGKLEARPVQGGEAPGEENQSPEAGGQSRQAVEGKMVVVEKPLENESGGRDPLHSAEMDEIGRVENEVIRRLEKKARAKQWQAKSDELAARHWRGQLEEAEARCAEAKAQLQKATTKAEKSAKQAKEVAIGLPGELSQVTKKAKECRAAWEKYLKLGNELRERALEKASIREWQSSSVAALYASKEYTDLWEELQKMSSQKHLSP